MMLHPSAIAGSNNAGAAAPDSESTSSLKTMPAHTLAPDATQQGSAMVLLLALMMFAAPALGVPYEEMLQDTFKSIIVSFTVLGVGMWFFWRQRSSGSLRWHGVVWLPLLLMAYALGSMAWSHAYLAGVEAVRWFVFGLLTWLGVNTMSRDRLPLLAWGVHCGAVMASLWAVLQFWFDFSIFPQARNPASSFANRNFFAEYIVSTLPFSALLLAGARERLQIALLAGSIGLVLVAAMMTGTRGALMSMWLQIILILPFIAWVCRKQLAFKGWDGGRRILAVVVLLAMVFGLGMIKTGSPTIVAEGRGMTALERASTRTRSISTEDASLAVRLVMWKSTAKMIGSHFLSGVGAGAWEREIPLYQVEGSETEDDFYAHNEFLQLIAEYGIAGWVFLIALLAYLARSGWRTLTLRSLQAELEAPWRAVALCSLLSLLIVSSVGFVLHMACTAALLALGLGILGASDSRLGDSGTWSAGSIRWKPTFSHAMAICLANCTALAIHIAQQAIEGERNILGAMKLALGVTATGDYKNPQLDTYKSQVLKLIKAGTDINPNNRRTTVPVGDELARWGDWKNATSIWESVLPSHPYVVVILTNIGRGYARTGQPEKSMEYLERARKIQPDAKTVKALEVVLLSQMEGQNQKALALARDALQKNLLDYDMLTATFALGTRTGDYATALRAMDMRLKTWPDEKPGEAYLQLGNMYDGGLKDAAKALESFQHALDLVPPAQRYALLGQIPARYLPLLSGAKANPPGLGLGGLAPPLRERQ